MATNQLEEQLEYDDFVGLTVGSRDGYKKIFSEKNLLNSYIHYKKILGI